jgi:hypothetical protein
LPEHLRPGAPLGAIVALAEAHRARQVWIHPFWWKAARLPKKLPADATDRDGFAHGWAGTETLPLGWHLFRPGQLKFWVRAYRKGARGSIALALPQLEERADWSGARNAQELLEALLLLRNLLGTRYQSGPGSWFRTVIERSRKRGAFEADLAPINFPLPWHEMPSIAPQMAWERSLLDDERRHRYVWRFDNNKNFIAAMNRLRLPLGVPELVKAGSFDPKRAGCWQARITGEPHHAGLLPHPCYRTGAHAGFDAPAWYTSSQLARAQSLGCKISAAEAWIYPRSAPMLEQTYRLVRDAFLELDRLESAGNRSAALATSILKDSYTRGLGWLDLTHEREEDEPIDLHRPDWYAEIRAAGWASILRQLHTAADFSGRAPFAIAVDACYFTSDCSDPIKAAREIGLPLGRRLGVFKPDGFARLSAVLQLLKREDNHLVLLSRAMREPKDRAAIRAALERADDEARARAAARQS